MRCEILLQMLEISNYLRMEEIEQQLNLSKRSILNLIKSLRTDGIHHGFQIVTIRNQGYQLIVEDQDLFNAYRASMFPLETITKQERIPRILFYLFQQRDFIPLSKLEEALKVSRNTIIGDLKQVNELLKGMELEVEAKKHFGIRVIGPENNYRQGMAKFVLGYQEYTESVKPFLTFMNDDFEDLRVYLKELLIEGDLSINPQSIESIMDHLKVLLYRAKQGNYIASFKANQEISEVFYEIGTHLVKWIEHRFDISLPNEELLYLTAQIAGKTTASTIPQKEHDRLVEEITSTLFQLGEEFDMNFSEDQLLIDSLVMHMYPLLNRISFQMSLENPLIDMVSSRYANVFLIALRFSELWEMRDQFKLSRDEMGYLALHFASYIERRKSQAIDKIKRVLVISGFGGGNAMLLRGKLQNIFVQATIASLSVLDLERIQEQEADLILSSIPIEEGRTTIPIIYIHSLIDERELSRIKEQIVFHTYIHPSEDQYHLFNRLFKENLFQYGSHYDYLTLVQEMASKMTKLGYANEDFAEMVLKREERFSTVYQNGVAGPHSMILNGNENCISVFILKQPLVYHEKEVSIIFLLNIKDGNLFIYREISHFLLKIMEQKETIKELLEADQFEKFKHIIFKVLGGGLNV